MDVRSKSFQPPVGWAGVVDGLSLKASPFLGAFGWFVLAGLALVGLGTLLAFANDVDEVADEDVLPAVLRGVGTLAVAGGLACAGLFARELALTLRTALVIAGAYFLLAGSSVSTLIRGLV